MMTARSISLVCLALGCSVEPAFAQRAVVTLGVVFVPPVTLVIDLASGRVESTLTGAAVVLDPMFTADGRYLTFYVPGAIPRPLQVRDVIAGGTISVAVDFERVVAHPRNVAIYGFAHPAGGFTAPRSATPARLDAGGVHELGGCGPADTTNLDLSADGARLLTLCTSGRLNVLDTAGGQVLRAIAAGIDATDLVAGYDGSAALVLRQPASGAGRIVAIDTTTGAERGSTTFPQPTGEPPCTMTLAAASPDRRFAAVSCTQFASIPPYATRMLDTESLTWGPPLPVPYFPSAFVISADNRTAYVSSADVRRSSLDVIDLPTATTTFRDESRYVYGLAIAEAPLAPILTHTVAGRRVDLQWTLPAHSPAPLHGAIEIGTAPGLSNLGIISVDADGRLAVPAAPPGRYYVRARAGNAVGPGSASNEIVVDVP